MWSVTGAGGLPINAGRAHIDGGANPTPRSAGNGRRSSPCTSTSTSCPHDPHHTMAPEAFTAAWGWGQAAPWGRCDAPPLRAAAAAHGRRCGRPQQCSCQPRAAGPAGQLTNSCAQQASGGSEPAGQPEPQHPLPPAHSGGACRRLMHTWRKLARHASQQAPAAPRPRWRDVDDKMATTAALHTCCAVFAVQRGLTSPGGH